MNFLCHYSRYCRNSPTIKSELLSIQNFQFLFNFCLISVKFSFKFRSNLVQLNFKSTSLQFSYFDLILKKSVRDFWFVNYRITIIKIKRRRLNRIVSSFGFGHLAQHLIHGWLLLQATIFFRASFLHQTSKGQFMKKID